MPTEQANWIRHLYHSGTMIHLNRTLLIFDYALHYRRWEKSEELQMLRLSANDLKAERVMVFASHAHPDHFEQEIYEWHEERADIQYVLSSDISSPPSFVHRIHPGETLAVDEIRVNATPASDQGVAFSVSVEGQRVYFAGDNAVWSWEGDIERDEQEFLRRYLGPIDRSPVIDIACIVCDGRLNGRGEGGVIQFANEFAPRLIVPLHANGPYSINSKVEKDLRNAGFKGEFWAIHDAGETRHLKPSTSRSG